MADVTAPARQVVPWSAIANDPEVKSLSSDDYDALRRDYFGSVIAPELQANEIDEIWTDFDRHTSRGLRGDIGATARRLDSALPGGDTIEAIAPRGIMGKAATPNIGVDIENEADRQSRMATEEAQLRPIQPRAEQPAPFDPALAPGLVTPGNIDILNRPQVKNPDGSISTVRSMSFNMDGKEVLVPTVSEDGRIMSDEEAVDTYRKTGKHLGVFDTPESATTYSQRLHAQQDAYYRKSPQAPTAAPTVTAQPPPDPERSAIEGLIGQAEQDAARIMPDLVAAAPSEGIEVRGEGGIEVAAPRLASGATLPGAATDDFGRAVDAPELQRQGAKLSPGHFLRRPSPAEEPGEFSKGVATGVLGAGQMATAAATIPPIERIKARSEDLAAFDEIDAGQTPAALSRMTGPERMASPLADYAAADPATRAKLRERAVQAIAEDQESRDLLIESWGKYQAELKATAGRVANATDIKDAQGFWDWFKFNVGQGVPYLGGAAVAGILGGLPGIAIFGGVVGVGDIQSGNIERGKPENTMAAVVGAAPYGALELLGPVGRAFRGIPKAMLERAASSYFKRAGKEIPASAVEEFINEAGQEIIKDFSVATGTGEPVVTKEGLVRWLNAGMAGVAVGAPAGAVTAIPESSGAPAPPAAGLPPQGGTGAAPAPARPQPPAAPPGAAPREPTLGTVPEVAPVTEPTLQTAPVQDTAEPALQTEPEVEDAGPTLKSVPDVDAPPKSEIEIAAEPLQVLFTDQQAREEASALDQVAAEAAPSPANELPEPTDGQRDAENFKMGHADVSGVDLTIQYPVGAKRSGLDAQGKKWEREMSGAHYGRIVGVPARAPDKEHLDFYLKEGTPKNFAGDVFVVNQTKDDGSFDEPKIFIGYTSSEEAEAAYLENMPEGWSRYSGVAPVPFNKFRVMLQGKSSFLKPVPGEVVRTEPATTAVVDTAEAKVAGAPISSVPDRMLADAAEKAGAKGEAAKHEQARRTKTTPLADSRLKDPAIAAELQRMPAEAGWAEVGGRLTRTPTGEAAGEEIIGRTTWIPKAEWFMGGLGNEKFITEAVRKAVAGEPMRATEKRTIVHMLDYLEGHPRTQTAEVDTNVLDDLGVLDNQPEESQALEDYLKDARVRLGASVVEGELDRLGIQYEGAPQAQYEAAVRSTLDERIRSGENPQLRQTQPGAESESRPAGGGDRQAFKPEEAGGQPAQQVQSRAGGQALDLTAPTEADLKAQQDTLDAQAATEVKALADAKAERERKEIAERSKKADFTLDATEAVDKKTQAEADKKKAEAQLAGQTDLLGQPGAPTVADIHAKADELGIKWDDDAAFMARTKTLTGKEHLDDLTPAERQTVFDSLEKPAAPATPATAIATALRNAADAIEQSLNPEQRPAAREVAKPTPATSEPGKAGVAPGREAGVPDLASEQGRAQYVVDEVPENQARTETAAREPGPSQGDLFAATPLPGTKIQGIESWNFEPRRTGTLKVGFDRIDTPEKAAHAFAALRKSPREHFQLIVTDEQGSPIAAAHLFSGALTQTAIYPEVVMKAIYQTPGARFVWMAHNHPSGTTSPSRADEDITRALGRTLGKDFGVEMRGHVVIAGTKATMLDAQGNPEGASFDIPPAARKFSIPIMERKATRAGKPGDGLSSPAAVRDFFRKFNPKESGLVVLDAQHRVIGWLPMTLAEMSMQRTGSSQTGAAKFMADMGRMNPGAMIAYAQDGSIDTFKRAVANIGAVASALDIRMLDGFMRTGDTFYSMAERGEMTAAPTFFSRSQAPQTEGLSLPAFRAALAGAFGEKVATRLLDSGILNPLADQSQLPERVVPFLRSGDQVFGFYDPRTDKAYAVLSNLTAEDVRGLALHEVGVHFGFRKMLGDKQYKQVMKRLDVMVRAGHKTVREARANAEANVAHPSQIEEETLAYMVQNHPRMNIVREIIAAIKAFLFREFGIGGKFLSDADMVMLARAAVQKAGVEARGVVDVLDTVFSREEFGNERERTTGIPGGDQSDQERTTGIPGGAQERSATGASGVDDLSTRFSRAGRRAAPTEAEAREGLLAAYRRVAKRAIDSLDRIADPFVTLPGRKEFMAKRGLTQGLIDNTNDLTKALRKAFLPASTEDRKAVFAYLITAGANTDAIIDPKIQQAAKDAKDLIRKVGDELVRRGMLDEATRRDSYLPQVYLKYLLDTKDFRRLGSGKKPSSMEYLLKRKYEMKASPDGKVTLIERESGLPVPDETILSLGPVTDPAFLSGMAVARPMRDIALMDWLLDISKGGLSQAELRRFADLDVKRDPTAAEKAERDAFRKRYHQWVLPGSTVTWNDKTVSAYWLKEEAARIRKQARYYGEVDGAKATALAEKMDAAADAALEGIPTDRERFRQMPNTARMGHMRGIWVREEIFNDIMGIQDMIPTNPGWAQDLFGYGGRGTKAVQIWKTMKVPMNIPGQFRNFGSNAVLLNLSGVPARSIPRLMVRSIDELRDNGTHWKIAKKYGVRASTFSAQELQRLKTEYLELERNAGNLNIFGLTTLLAKKTANFTGDVYQLTEALFKTAKIMHAMEKGADEATAVDEAQKWLFDYSNVPKSVRYLRGAPVGIPFITFTTKVLPRLVEVAALHPQRYLPWAGLYFGLQAGLAALLDVDYDDLEKLKKAMPEWIQKAGHAVLLPYKDELGRWQVVDLAYFMPWIYWTQIGKDITRGEIGEAFRDTGAVAGPMVDLATAYRTGIDPFTKREIANKGDPVGQQILSWMNYHWSMVAPPMLTDRGTLGKAIEAYSGETNKYGDPRRTYLQAAASLFGVNVNAIEPEQTRAANVARMQFEVREAERVLDEILQDRNLSDDVRDRRQARQEAEIEKRQQKVLKYMDESEINPKLLTE